MLSNLHKATFTLLINHGTAFRPRQSDSRHDAPNSTFSQFKSGSCAPGQLFLRWNVQTSGIKKLGGILNPFLYAIFKTVARNVG